MQSPERTALRFFLIFTLWCGLMHAANLAPALNLSQYKNMVKQYNFTDFGVTMIVPNDWHITYYNDRELYVTENPLVNNHWDEKGFIFGAIWIADDPSACPVAKSILDQKNPNQFMTPVLDDGDVAHPIPDHYLMSVDELPWRKYENGTLYQVVYNNYTIHNSLLRHPHECIVYYSRLFYNYVPRDLFEDPPVYVQDQRLPPYPNQDLYYLVVHSIVTINITKKEPNLYILTSLDALCPDGSGNATCAIANSLTNLRGALTAEGYTVQLVSLEKGSGSSLDAALAREARQSFHEVAKNITENTTIFIVGSYNVVPPCLYDDPVETESVPGFMDNESPRMFISDDCYGTYGDGPSEAVVARLPTKPVADAVHYIDAMADYHSTRAAGASGLNHDRLKDMYDKECPTEDMDFYNLYRLPGTLDFFDYSTGVHLQEYGQPWSGGGPQAYYAFPLQYFAFHGGPKNNKWFAGDSPVIKAESQPYPFSSLSASCFGGYLSGSSIPETWTLSQTGTASNRPNAFIGSTDISYYSDTLDFPIGADILLNGYHEGLESGKPMGEALRDAKRYTYTYDYSDRLIGGALNWLKNAFGITTATRQNMKNAMTYQMYGDPLLTKADMINSDAEGCDRIG